jgi:hypothetical protein
MSEKEDETVNLERKEAGMMLYMSLLEVFAKYKIFENPKRVVEVLLGTVEVFVKNWIEATPDNEVDIIKLLLKGLEELAFRIREKA